MAESLRTATRCQDRAKLSMNDAVRIAVLIGLAWVTWLVLRPRVTFLIRIKGGEGSLERGTAPRGLLAEVNELCRREALQTGSIRGRTQAGRTGLDFSREIPPGARQQLRNWWVSTQFRTPSPSERC